MARGGARPGAGRKQGAATKRTREVADKAAAEGITPLEYMLGVMRDEEQTDAVRLDAAKSAAPFVHPKLSSIEAKLDGDIKTTIRRIERVVVDPQNPDA